jgi:hypothetical protein
MIAYAVFSFRWTGAQITTLSVENYGSGYRGPVVVQMRRCEK